MLGRGGDGLGMKITKDKYKAVIFDVDGSLVDSMWIWGAIDREYLAAHGFEVPDGLQMEIGGLSMKETAVYFQERFGIRCYYNHLPVKV